MEKMELSPQEKTRSGQEVYMLDQINKEERAALYMAGIINCSLEKLTDTGNFFRQQWIDKHGTDQGFVAEKIVSYVTQCVMRQQLFETRSLSLEILEGSDLSDEEKQDLIIDDPYADQCINDELNDLRVLLGHDQITDPVAEQKIDAYFESFRDKT